METVKYYLSTDCNVSFKSSASDLKCSKFANCEHLYKELSEAEYLALTSNKDTDENL